MFKAQSKHILATAALSLLGFQAIAQPSIGVNNSNESKAGKASSPLSRFGMGEFMSNNTVATRSIGGAATAYNNPFVINTFNPATYAFSKTTMFDFSFEGRANNFSVADETYKSSTFSVSSLSLGVPVGKNAGLVVGFKPITNTYYRAEDTAINPSMGKVYNIYNVSGALNNVFVGFGYKYKGFSLGANLGYTFGQLRRSSAIEPNNILQYANIEMADYNSINGVDLKVGAIYQHVYNEKYYLNFGATYALGNKLNVTRDQYAMSYRYNATSDGSTIIDPIDTIAALTSVGQKGELTLPTEFSAGVHWGKSAYWNVGVDYINSNWTAYDFMGDRTNIADRTSRIALGAEITPDPKAEKNRFILNASFRGGIYYGTDYLTLNGKQLDYLGGSVGASFPVRTGGGLKSFGSLNLGVDFGSRGSLTENNVKQSYTKFSAGFTFNDIWFIKRKFD